MSHSSIRPGARIALTGSNGLIGSHVADLLLTHHYRLRILQRSTVPSADPCERVERVLGDLDSPQHFRTFLEGSAALVHAGFQHEPGKYRGGEGSDAKAFWQVNMAGTLALIEAAAACGVKRVILFSSRAVFSYAPCWQGRLVDEQVIPDPDSHYGLQKYALECITRLAERKDLTLTTLRPTGVYAEKDLAKNGKWLPLIASILEQSQPLTLRARTEISALNVANAVRLCIEAPREQVAGKVFNLSDYLLTPDLLLGMLADCLQMPPPFFSPLPMRGPALYSQYIKRLGYRPGTLDELKENMRRTIAAFNKKGKGQS